MGSYTADTPTEVGDALTDADLGEAEDDHKEEGGENVDPEVNNDHQGEHVDRVVALLGLHPGHPHSARH